MKPQPRKIAIFRALYLGDLLLSVPAFRAMRAAYPDAEISLIGLPWAREFASRFSAYLDRFVEFEGYPGITELPVDIDRTRRFLREQQAYGYDLAIQMHGGGRTSSPFVAQLGARETVGYAPGHLASLLTKAQTYPNGQPEVLRNLALARLAGAPSTNAHLEFPLFQSDRRAAADVFDAIGVAPGKDFIVCIHPGGKSSAKRWPASYFAEVADLLVERLRPDRRGRPETIELQESRVRVIITGSAGEQELTHEVGDAMRHEAFVLAGRTPLGALGAAIANSNLVITNSTGPAHIAEAVDTPAVILFGPTEYRRWAPLDQGRQRAIRRPVPCSPCEKSECPIDQRCLRGIPPSWVATVAQELVGETVAAGAVA